jgi:hypothetical protein
VLGANRQGSLEAEALARHRGYATRELVLLVEAVAGLLAAAAAPAGAEGATARARQLLRLSLPRPEAREARRAMATPRPPAVLAAAAPPRVRPFLLEQLLLVQLRVRLDEAAAADHVEAFVAGAGLEPQAVGTARVEAAAQHDDHLAWFEAVDGGALDWEAIGAAWESTADDLVERVGEVVTGNLEALVIELKETGELGQLLALAAAGKTLDAEQKRKVKAQLIDLAKAIPALAIFAAPGGMLLLPLLAKLLPFNMLPSAWDRTGRDSVGRLALGPVPAGAPPALPVAEAADAAGPGRGEGATEPAPPTSGDE